MKANDVITPPITTIKHKREINTKNDPKPLTQQTSINFIVPPETKQKMSLLRIGNTLRISNQLIQQKKSKHQRRNTYKLSHRDYTTEIQLNEQEKSYYEKRENFPFDNTPLFMHIDSKEKSKMFGEDLDVINAICDFEKETHLYMDTVDVISETEFMELSQRYINEREVGESSLDVDQLLTLFYYCLANDVSEQAMVYYYQLKDMEGMPQSDKMIRLFTLMALQEGKSSEPRYLVLSDVYKTIKKYTWYTLNEVDITIFMKAFAKIGAVRECLELWESIYKINLLPEPQHMLSMLLASSLCADPKRMSQFYQRLVRKGMQPENFLLKVLIKNWGRNKDVNWLKSEESNLSVDDYCWTVGYALRVHNYKVAYEMVNEIANLSQPPSAQLYEIFYSAICRDLPFYRREARLGIQRLRKITNISSKFQIDNFHNMVQSILNEFGDAAEDLPEQPKPTKPSKLTLSRRQKSTLYKSDGGRRPRFETHGSNDFSNLFAFDPKYLNRLEEWRREEEEYAKKEESFDKIDQKIQENIEKENQAKQQLD
eukprot:TRINITY_DN578_c0_g3_i1.p1 TRINITY_DN578_c0_g3~~TRINITY_DN578_c0_g3_i1.p1  ORF type:complete len:541 (-),score=124.94 TRINITY_DN578_c0_g3_i1:19-1641(-)